MMAAICCSLPAIDDANHGGGGVGEDTHEARLRAEGVQLDERAPNGVMVSGGSVDRPAGRSAIHTTKQLNK